MRRLLVLAVLLAVGCATQPDVPLTETPLVTEEAVTRPDRFLGNLRGAMEDHVADCQRGLSFTWRCLSRGTASDVERLVETFD